VACNLVAATRQTSVKGTRSPHATCRCRRCGGRLPPRRALAGGTRVGELLGYNILGFFTPEIWYDAQICSLDAVSEFKKMVRTLQEARARGDPRCGLQPHRRREPTRADAVAARHRQLGLLPRSPEETRYYMDFTGCGNTLNMHASQRAAVDHGQPALLGPEMHVDGFRFDLASGAGPRTARGCVCPETLFH
jgi:hypothetical protein